MSAEYGGNNSPGVNLKTKKSLLCFCLCLKKSCVYGSVCDVDFKTQKACRVSVEAPWGALVGRERAYPNPGEPSGLLWIKGLVMKRSAPEPLYFVDPNPIEGPSPQRLTCIRSSAVQAGNIDVNSILQDWRNNGGGADYWNSVDAYAHCYVNQITFFESNVCRVQLQSGIGYDVIITRWYSPNEFSVVPRIFRPLMDMMDAAMNALYSEIAAFLPRSNFNVGMPCCVMSRSGRWRRAQIETVMMDEYHVRTIDTGEWAFVERQQTYLLLTCFADLPPMALSCKMQEFERRPIDFAIQRFFRCQRKTSEHLFMTFTKIVDNILTVQLFNSVGQNLFDVFNIEQLRENGGSLPAMHSIQAATTFLRANGDSKCCAAPKLACSFLTVNLGAFNTTLHFDKVVLAKDQVENQGCTRLTNPIVPLNVPALVEVLAIDVNAGVGVFRFSDEGYRLKCVEQYLSALVENVPSGFLAQNWNAGDTCIVRRPSHGNAVYRAIIVDILPNEYATVRSYDYAFQANEPLSQLCRLSDNPITNYPPLAFSARISSLAEEVRNGMLTEEGSISPEFFTKQWKTVFSCDSEGLLYEQMTTDSLTREGKSD
ncbi:hypothetical protein M514_04108 [Trichuris suis]|uniref:Tudor domain-containing protein n=1 Tax=Trichuris suis TaxID=68888 RepID=A0A085NG08_9BILA|nr:hypothetical protein M514_04108 [Trichuris suis]